MQNTSPMAFAFGPFVFDVERGALLHEGRDIRLRPQSCDVLTYLLENPGRLVTRDELLETVWGRTVVTDDSLTQCMIDIRRAIGDRDRRMIRTVPRRGFILEVPVTVHKDAIRSEGAPAASGLRSATVLATAALALLLGGAAWWTARTQAVDLPATSGAAAALPSNSIAVLPFVDMSAARDQAYFAEGISEEILNLLAKTKGLSVVARTSSFAFRDAPLDIITTGRRLNVAYILEGSVRKSGDRIRVTTQLVETSGGTHVWSETYDSETGDILEIQDQVARSVADSLRVTLASAANASSTETDNPQAYERFLQARFLFGRRGPGDLDLAEQYYQEALALDPGFARAWSGLAGVLSVQMFGKDFADERELARLKEASERALTLDPLLADGHVRMSGYLSLVGDCAGAAEHRQTAFELSPDDPLVLAVAAGGAMHEGRFDEGIALQRRAVALDPLGFANRGNLAHFLLVGGDFEAAQKEFATARGLSPARSSDVETSLGHALILQRRFDQALPRVQGWPDGEDRNQALAMIYGSLGRDSDAEAAIEALTGSWTPAIAVRLAEVHSFLGRTDDAFAQLQSLADEAAPGAATTTRLLRGFNLSPFLRSLHDDPRWQHLLAQAPGVCRSRE